MLTIRWRRASLMLVAISVVALPSCSSGVGTSAAPSGTSAAAVPQRPATAAEVATNMRKIEQIAQQVSQSAGTNKAKAVSLDAQIEPLWRPIEATVRLNDQDTYLALEDGFAALEQAANEGNAAAAAKGSAGITSTVQAYLAKYSG
jgi:hypothetical protein